MSSLVRRLQIAGFKKQGLLRTKYELVRYPNGEVRQRPVRRGGLIVDGGNNPVGYRWPRGMVA